MSSYLYRLGHWAFRRRWLVLGFWVAMLVGVGALSQAVKEDESDAFNVPGTESQRALDLLDEKFPGTGGATARMVFAAPEGRTLAEPRYQKIVRADGRRARRRCPRRSPPASSSPRASTLSTDERVAFADLHFESRSRT